MGLRAHVEERRCLGDPRALRGAAVEMLLFNLTRRSKGGCRFDMASWLQSLQSLVASPGSILHCLQIAHIVFVTAERMYELKQAAGLVAHPE